MLTVGIGQYAVDVIETREVLWHCKKK